MLHVLNQGITPKHAGVRYIALLLDYGFYVGVRLATRVDLFQKDADTPVYKDLRHLPKFPIAG